VWRTGRIFFLGDPREMFFSLCAQKMKTMKKIFKKVGHFLFLKLPAIVMWGAGLFTMAVLFLEASWFDAGWSNIFSQMMKTFEAIPWFFHWILVFDLIFLPWIFWRFGFCLWTGARDVFPRKWFVRQTM
jgi:hypothetical protein